MFTNSKKRFKDVFYGMCYFAFDINHDEEMRKTYQDTFLGAIYLENKDILLVPQGYHLLLRMTPQKFVSLSTGDVMHTKINGECYFVFLDDLIPYQNFSTHKDSNHISLNKVFPNRIIKKLIKKR